MYRKKGGFGNKLSAVGIKRLMLTIVIIGFAQHDCFIYFRMDVFRKFIRICFSNSFPAKGGI